MSTSHLIVPLTVVFSALESMGMLVDYTDVGARLMTPHIHHVRGDIAIYIYKKKGHSRDEG